MTTYRSITIQKGPGGFGGPYTVTPDEKHNKIVYIVGGGARPEVVDRIAELTGAEPVNGFKTSVPDDEIFLAVIDCGGTLRCGLYPKKGIHTVNVMQTGKAGPLAQYITEDLYVSAVSSDQVSLADGTESANVGATESGVTAAGAAGTEVTAPTESKGTYSTDKKISETIAGKKKKSILEKIGLGGRSRRIDFLPGQP